MNVQKQNRFSGALRHRNFCLLLASMIVINLIRSMERVLSSWFVLELTDSPLLLGVSTAMEWVPTILGVGILAGIVADRFDRLKIIKIVRIWSMVPAFAMAVLISTGSIQVWHILVCIVLAGISFPLYGPASTVLMLDVVGKNDLASAIGLQMLCTRVETSIGPAVGGLLIDRIGVGGCYYLEVALYIVGLIPLFLIRGVKKTASTTEKKSALNDLTAGLRYIRGDSALIGVLSMAAVWNFFICSYEYTLIPVFARDILGVGATGLGMLKAASGVGSLAASLIVMLLGDSKRKGLLHLISCGALGAVMLLFSVSTFYPLSLLLMFFNGLTESMMMGIESILLLTLPPEEMQGRVRGARSQVIMTLPFGEIMLGALTVSLSAPFAGLLGAIPFILSTLMIDVMVPKLRKQ